MSYKKYDFEIEYACGHVGQFTQGGYTYEYARDIADKEEMELCPECRYKELKEKGEAALKKAAAKGYAELRGREQQVYEAAIIRQELAEALESERFKRKEQRVIIPNFENKLIDIDVLNKLRKAYADEEKSVYSEKLSGIMEDFYKNIELAAMFMLMNETSAKAYLENKRELKMPKDKNDIWRIAKVVYKYDFYDPEEHRKKKLAEEQALENYKKRSVIPKNYNDFMVRIKADRDAIETYSNKNYDLIQIVKKLGYRWEGNRCWRKELNEFTGDYEDRVVELANQLLVLGFGVVFEMDNFRQLQNRALKADYKPEQTKWIKKAGPGEFFITWTGYDDSLYKKAKRINGAFWRGGAMSVPVESYKEILDFAEVEGFGVSQKVKEEIDRYKELISTTKPVAKKEPEEKKDVLGEILKDRGILEDLIEEE